MTVQPQDPRVVVDEKVAKGAVVKRYLIAIALSLVMFVLMLYSQGIFKGYDAVNDKVNHNLTAWVFHKLCDSFSITGVVCCCLSGLLFCSNKGAYDTIFFGVRQAFGVAFKDPKKLKYKDLYEYKQAKAKSKTEFKYLLWIGLSYLVLGLICLIVYYNVNI